MNRLDQEDLKTEDLITAALEFSAQLPESLKARSRNPNLHRVEDETGPERAPQRSGTLRRKKPSGPDPFVKNEELTGEDFENEAGSTQQLFWKFHILRFGPSLYLTTNPTLRHLHCRNAPGYFVKVAGNSLKYTLIFEDIETGESLVEVEKIPDRSSYRFAFRVRKKRVLRDGIIIPVQTIEEKLIDYPDLEEEEADGNAWLDCFLGILTRKPIPPVLLPKAPSVPMLNYEGEMLDGHKWNVGSLPRYRESRLNSSETKYIAKKHVYFHRCFADLDSYYGWNVPPAIAVFRECESKPKKRVIQQLNRLLRVGPVASAKSDPEPNPSPFAEVTPYNKSGDGVYLDNLPLDDEPDHHHKLGWITVYEDEQKFSQRGMFDLVVALTMAIGYENHLNFGPID